MKRMIAFLLFFPLAVMAQEGISFQNQSWSNLLATAKKQNKLIFVDAYAVWCGPCKSMAKEVFPLKEVGSFFNQNFINAKIDMEKGEGVDIAERYNVAAYPTYLFVNGNGELVHKGIGYLPADEFITVAKNALNPETQYYSLKKKFLAGGKLTAAAVRNLLDQAKELGDEDASSMAQTFMQREKNNWLTEEMLEILLTYTQSPDEESYKFLEKNKAKASELIGATILNDGMDNIVFRYATEKVPENADLKTAVATIEQVMKKFRPERANEYALLYGVYMSNEMQNTKEVIYYTIAYMDKYQQKQDWRNLNEYAWFIHENSNDKNELLKALGWALNSVKLESNYYNNDTVAHLYYKTGDKKNAKIYAQTALKLGKEAGEDTNGTEELLKKL